MTRVFATFESVKLYYCFFILKRLSFQFCLHALLYALTALPLSYYWGEVCCFGYRYNVLFWVRWFVLNVMSYFELDVLFRLSCLFLSVMSCFEYEVLFSYVLFRVRFIVTDSRSVSNVMSCIGCDLLFRVRWLVLSAMSCLSVMSCFEYNVLVSSAMSCFECKVLLQVRC